MKASSDELLQVVKDVTQLLSKESGRIGSLRITGRLVNVPSRGKMIVVGDIHGDLESLGNILKDSDFMKKNREGEDFLLVFLGDYGDRGFYSPEVYYVI